MLVLIADPDIEAALGWEVLIPAMERALAAFSAGGVVQPAREWLTLEEGERYVGVMPAAASRAAGLKVVSFYPKNNGTATPTIMATVLLIDPESGEHLAVMDGRIITARRTAAVSAAVTRRLAPPNSRVLAILGSGAQAESHLSALRHVCAFEDVRIWSRTPAHAERLAARHGARAMGAEAAVRGADVVVTVTGSRTPVLHGAWLKRGAHVNAIGAPMPDWRELDDDAMRNVVVVESREAAMKESGDLILSGTPIHAEVGELFAGSVTVPAGETTIYKSVGMAIEDISAARLVYDAVIRGKASGPGR